MNAMVRLMMTVRRRRGLVIIVASQPRRQYVHAVTINTMLNASGTSKSMAGPRSTASPMPSPKMAGTIRTMLNAKCDTR